MPTRLGQIVKARAAKNVGELPARIETKLEDYTVNELKRVAFRN